SFAREEGLQAAPKVHARRWSLRPYGVSIDDREHGEHAADRVGCQRPIEIAQAARTRNDECHHEYDTDRAGTECISVKRVGALSAHQDSSSMISCSVALREMG